MITESFKAGIEFNVLGVIFDLPDFKTIFDNGIASAIGWVLSFAFMFLLAIWIVFSVIAAFKITRSGMEKEMEEGMTLIKNAWISATVGLLFFAFLSVIGSFIGIGNFAQWGYTLSQCHDSRGGFYFMDIAALEISGIEIEEGTPIYCCKIDEVGSMPDEYYDAGYEDETYRFVIGSGTLNGTSGCVEFNKYR